MTFNTYRVYCDTEGAHIFSGPLSAVPVVCPNNPAHTIRQFSWAVVEPESPSESLNIAERDTHGLSFFHNGRRPYVEVSSTGWKSIGQFPFPGTNYTRPPVIAKAIIWGNRPGVAGVRIRDVTDPNDEKTIAEDLAISMSDDPVVYFLSVPSNLPTQHAVFEIQAKRVTQTVRVSFVGMGEV